MSSSLHSRDLRAFLALAEELHFGRAAERLGVAQPPFSQQIRRLEDQLGARLFDRTTRAVRLTAVGQIFLEKIRGAAMRIDEAVRLVRLAPAEARTHLAVGFIQPAMYTPLPSVLREYCATNPHVMLEVAHMSSAEQVEALREDRLHVGLIRPPAESAGLKLEVVAREGFSIVLPAGHRASKLRRLHLADLAGERFIDFQSSSGDTFPHHVAPYCRRAGLDPDLSYKTRTVAATLTLVAARAGVALLPRWVDNIAPREVVIRPTNEIPSLVELAIAWRPEHAPEPARQLIAALRKAYRSSVEQRAAE